MGAAPKPAMVTTDIRKYLDVDPAALSFKVLTSEGKNIYAGRRISLQRPFLTRDGWTSGAWGIRRKKPVLCERGWHLTDLDHIASWMHNYEWDRVYIAEGMGASHVGHDKVAWETARLLAEVRSDAITSGRLVRELGSHRFASPWPTLGVIAYRAADPYGAASAQERGEYRQMLTDAWKIIITRSAELDAAEAARG